MKHIFSFSVILFTIFQIYTAEMPNPYPRSEIDFDANFGVPFKDGDNVSFNLEPIQDSYVTFYLQDEECFDHFYKTINQLLTLVRHGVKVANSSRSDFWLTVIFNRLVTINEIGKILKDINITNIQYSLGKHTEIN